MSQHLQIGRDPLGQLREVLNQGADDLRVGERPQEELVDQLRNRERPVRPWVLDERDPLQVYAADLLQQ